MTTKEDDAQGATSPEGEDRLRHALSSVRLLADVRQRAASMIGRADRLSATGLGLGYLVLAAGCATATGPVTAGTALLIALLVALYAVAYRTEFVATAGSAVPTEPILVGLLLAVPLPLVPLAVLAGLQLGAAGGAETGSWAHKMIARSVSGWHCLGPVAVLWAFPPGEPRLSAWPVYLGALAAQFVLDAAVAAVRSASLGVDPRQLVAPLRWTFTIDALLAPLGVCIVIAATGSPVLIPLLAMPIGLVRMLARDRTEHLETAVTLSAAYSVVEEEARMDALTGLANRRAWVLALDRAGEQVRQDQTLVATLLAADVDGLKRTNDTHGHDVGDELIQKVASVLAAVAPDGATVARLGGDEFGILLVAPAGESDGAGLLRTVRAVLNRHPGVKGVPLSASLGVAACPPVRSVAEAARLADLAAAEDKIERRAGRT